MFEKIVVAIDGSDHAEKAFDLACDIAKLYGASLALVTVPATGPVPEGLRRMAEIEHLVEERQPPAPESIGRTLAASASANAVLPSDEAKIWSALSGALLQRAKSAAKSKRVEVTSVSCDDGDPANVILGVAKSVNADLIAMGSRGLGDLAGLVLGSVSRKVASEAPCAVVTVK